MKISNLFKPVLSGLLSALLLTGFTGQERFVELEGYLNGRASANFADNSRNVRTLLSKGTRGEILEFKKLPSGNYGIHIKVLNGPQREKSFWVYHRLSDSDLSLYETAPWKNTVSRKTSAVERAKAVETVRDTQARAGDTQNSTPERSLRTDSRAAVELITHASAQVKKTGQEACADCEIAATAPEIPLLKPGRKSMSKACNALMNGHGELGPEGQSILSIMAEPDYARHFTANNALGRFCPNFNNLTDNEKLTAWTWFWTALAMEESSCNPTQEHGTTYVDRNGDVQVLNPVEGYGLWALERDRNVRSWRGEACSRIGKPEDQARCAIDIMVQTQLSQGRTASNNTMSYWGPVRRGHKQMIPHMRRLSLCF